MEGGPASQKLGAAGTRNLERTLLPRLRPLGPLNVTRRFLLLRTQLEASCATRRTPCEHQLRQLEPASKLAGSFFARTEIAGRKIQNSARIVRQFVPAEPYMLSAPRRAGLTFAEAAHWMRDSAESRQIVRESTRPQDYMVSAPRCGADTSQPASGNNFGNSVCALQDHALSWAGRGGSAFSSAGGFSGVAVAAVFADGFGMRGGMRGGPSVGTQCGVVR